MTWEARGGDIRAAAVDVCLVALARGELIRDGRRWRFGRRCFSNATVRRLINEGEAVRNGDVVRSAVGPATTSLSSRSPCLCRATLEPMDG